MSARAQSASQPSPILVSALFVCAIGLANGLLTVPGPWHAALIRPSWHPATWVFGPVWAVIGICATVAFAKAWETVGTGRGGFLVLAGINAVLNVAWSGLFFVARRPDLALADIAVLWVSIASLMVFLSRNGAKPAAMWLVPYLAWVSIAGVLNFEIVRLNGPF